MYAKFAMLLAGALLAHPTGHAPVTVHFYGDSIFKGWAFRQYDYPSPLEQIEGTAALLAQANGAAWISFRRTTVQDPADICMDRLTGIIEPHDLILFEDAGPHADRMTDYQHWLMLVRFCAGTRRLLYTTMFDYAPKLPLSTYDDPFPDSPVTPNDLFRQAGSYLDWNAEMDAARAVLEPQGVHVVNTQDGIHPTAWGNILLAASILRYEGVQVTNVEPLIAELMRQEQSMTDYGMNPPFTEEQARAWVATLLSP